MKSVIPKMSMAIFEIFISFATVFSQSYSLPFQSEQTPQYWVDAAFFRINDSMTSVEIYYSIALTELSFYQDSGKNLASYTFSVEVIDVNNKSVRKDSVLRTVAVRSPQEAADKNRGVIDELIFALSPGTYTLHVSFKDNHAKVTASNNLFLTVPPIGNAFQISSIQLASTITNTQTNKVFSKGGKFVVPNPSRRYRYNNSFLYIYYEVYNLLPPDSTSNSFQYEYAISDSAGDSLIVTLPRSVQKPGTSCAKMQTLDIRSLEVGKYQLSVKVTDLSSGQSYVGNQYFWIDLPKPEPLQAAVYLPMTPDDIKKYRDQIKYLAKPAELKLFDQLSPEGKEKFILNFWRSKDPTPETPENEYMQDYFSRLDYANKHFKARNGANGSDSDMGRIFIVYGQPDEVENHNVELSTKPYVIWYYFTSGRKYYFVFVDRNDDGIYALVQSNVEGEIHDDNWREHELR